MEKENSNEEIIIKKSSKLSRGSWKEDVAFMKRELRNSVKNILN